MKKTIFSIAAGAGVTALMALGGPAAQACDYQGSANNGDEMGTPGTNAYSNGGQTGNGGGGYVGTYGDAGFIEVGGEAGDPSTHSNSGYITGDESGGNLTGTLHISTTPGGCVNGNII